MIPCHIPIEIRINSSGSQKPKLPPELVSWSFSFMTQCVLRDWKKLTAKLYSFVSFTES